MYALSENHIKFLAPLPGRHGGLVALLCGCLFFFYFLLCVLFIRAFSYFTLAFSSLVYSVCLLFVLFVVTLPVRYLFKFLALGGHLLRCVVYFLV